MSKSRITNHTKYHANNESYDQVVMFKSDGLDNSQFRNQPQPKRYQNNYTASAHHPSSDPDAHEEFNTSRFSGQPPQSHAPMRPSNPMVVGEQSSSAVMEEDVYSGKQNVTNPFTQTTPQGMPNSSSAVRQGRAGQFVEQNTSYEPYSGG